MNIRTIYTMQNALAGTATFKDGGGVVIDATNAALRKHLKELTDRPNFFVIDDGVNRMATMSNVTEGELDNELIPNGFYLEKGSMDVRKDT